VQAFFFLSPQSSALLPAPITQIVGEERIVSPTVRIRATWVSDAPEGVGIRFCLENDGQTTRLAVCWSAGGYVRENGDRYNGSMHLGLAHGRGVHTWGQGTKCSRYDGEWQQGLRHGYGVFDYPPDTRYTGEFNLGSVHGKGRTYDKSSRFGDFFCATFLFANEPVDILPDVITECKKRKWEQLFRQPMLDNWANVRKAGSVVPGLGDSIDDLLVTTWVTQWKGMPAAWDIDDKRSAFPLELSGIDLSRDEFCDAIESMTIVARGSKLLLLTFHNCGWGKTSRAMTELNRIVEVMPALTELNLVNNDLDHISAVMLAKTLATKATLLRLNLHGNRIGDVGAAAVADLLASNRSLTVVKLAVNELGRPVADAESGMVRLANVLALVNRTVQVIHLYGNRLGDDGARAWAKCLHENPTLIAARFVATEDDRTEFYRPLRPLECSVDVTARGDALLRHALAVNTSLLSYDWVGCDARVVLDVQGGV
jgi:hypothetical protein